MPAVKYLAMPYLVRYVIQGVNDDEIFFLYARISIETKHEMWK